jgi:uncharacterized protein YndB with AHSA1/START domain
MMMTQDPALDPPADDEPVVVELELVAEPEDAFGYWTDSAMYQRWMGRTVELDPVPGGEYRVEMSDGFCAIGSFGRIDPPHRVEFTWGWAAGAGQRVLTGPQPDDLLPPGASTVTVTLTPTTAGTHLRLEHRGLRNETLRQNHQLAWTTYLARLAVVAAGGDPGPEPHG